MGQNVVCRGRATTVRCDDKGLSVIYHATEVVKTTKDMIILNTGGWKTATTKARMNQASNQFGLGYQVYQKNHQWYINYDGQTLVFSGPTLILSKF